MRGGKRAGAGRPSGEARVFFAARILPATVGEIRKRAFKSNVAVGRVLDRAFTPKIKNQKNQNENKNNTKTKILSGV